MALLPVTSAPARSGLGPLLAWTYAALVVVVFGYFLVDLPVQVTDSYGNLVQVASEPSLTALVSKQFHAQSYLRPLLWANIRVVLDLSQGHYFEWFRGWHVAQIALLVVLFVRLLRPATIAGAAVVPLGLAALVGMHTFDGTVREAFPINTFLTIVLCCFLAADLALGEPRRWKDVAAAVLLAFAALSVESGLLVAVVIVTAFAAGARGVSRGGAAAQVLLVAGYMALRFVVLNVGSPDLNERSSGFGFSYRSPEELIALFGGHPLPFYLYNAGASLLSVLLSEPRGGIWLVTRSVIEGPVAIGGLVNVTASLLGTAVIVAFAWRRRRAWRAGDLARDDRIVIVFIAVAIANAAISYAYTKDVILSPAGACYALALAVAARCLLGPGPDGRTVGPRAMALTLVLLSASWTFRAVGAHVGLRHAAIVERNEWAYVDPWLEREGLVPATPVARALKEQLQDDAVRRHPARPALAGRWTEWFAGE